MFLLEKYQVQDGQELFSDVSFLKGADLHRAGGKMVRVSCDDYVKLYEDYLDYSNQNGNADVLYEQHLKSRPFRLSVSGDFKDALAEDEQVILSLYSVICGLLGGQGTCGVFRSEGAYCFHFPNNVYGQSKYIKLGIRVKQDLTQVFPQFDIDDDIHILGQDGRYEVLHTENPNPQRYNLDRMLPDGALDLRVSSHQIFGLTAYKSSYSESILTPIIFSPSYCPLMLSRAGSSISTKFDCSALTMNNLTSHMYHQSSNSVPQSNFSQPSECMQGSHARHWAPTAPWQENVPPRCDSSGSLDLDRGEEVTDLEQEEVTDFSEKIKKITNALNETRVRLSFVKRQLISRYQADSSNLVRLITERNFSILLNWVERIEADDELVELYQDYHSLVGELDQLEKDLKLEELGRKQAECKSYLNVCQTLSEMSKKIQEMPKAPSRVEERPMAINLNYESDDSRFAALNFVLMIMLAPNRNEIMGNPHYRKEILSAIKQSFPEDVSRMESRFYWFFCNRVGNTEEDTAKREKLHKELIEAPLEYSYLTLAHYAKKSNPDMFNSWWTLWVDTAKAMLIKRPESTSLARLIHRLKFMQYIYFPEKVECHHWWQVSPTHASLQPCDRVWYFDFLSSYILESCRWPINGRQMTSRDILNGVSTDKSLSVARLAIREIQTIIHGKGKIGLEDQIQRLFNARVRKTFNDQPNKTAFRNGILLATTEGYTIEELKLEDYITFNTNQFLPRPGSRPPHLDEVLEYLSQVFPNDLDQNILTDMAGVFLGRPEKVIRFFVGSSNNSKSCLINLYRIALGDYCKPIDSAALSSSEGPNPQLRAAVGAKLLVCSEPDRNHSFNSTKIKSFTGDDVINARALYENGISFIPTFRVIVVCNEIPKFSNADLAIRRRFLTVPFLGLWVSQTDYNRRRANERVNVHVIDPHFNDKLKSWAPAFIWILLNFYDSYLANMRDNTWQRHPLITQATNKYWGTVNFLLKFFQENYEADPSSTVPFDDFMRNYEGFCRKDKERKMQDKDTCIEMLKMEEVEIDYIGDQLNIIGWRDKSDDDI